MKRALIKVLYTIAILVGYFPIYAMEDPIINERVVDGLRHAVARFYYDKGAKYQHAPELVPLVESLLDYIDSLPEANPNKQRLINNVRSTIEQREISSTWLVSKLFEIAHEKGDSSGEEAELFRHAFHLEEGDPALASRIGLFSKMGDLMSDVHYIIGLTYKPVYVSPGVRGKVERELRRRLPVSVIYPIPGHAKFSIPFLIRTNLQHIYPLAFSDAPVSAHGVRMSPEWFAIHDAFHWKDDMRFLAIVNHVMRMTDQYVKKGASAEEFLEAYIPYAVRSYNRMMESLEKLFEEIQRVGPEEEQRRAFAGYILMLHEYSPYNFNSVSPQLEEFEDAFTQGDLGTLMGKFIESVKRNLALPKAWESAEDLLMTSPLTGESPVSDEDIMKSLDEKLQHHKIREVIDAEERQKIMRDIARRTIERSRRFITVRTMWKDGFEEPMAIFPTLAHKWDNMDDSLALLEYAGVSIEKPDLSSIESPEEQYRVAQEVLGQVQGELQNLMDSFRATSERIIRERGLGEIFTRDFIEQTEDMRMQLERLLPQQQEPIAVGGE